MRAQSGLLRSDYPFDVPLGSSYPPGFMGVNLGHLRICRAPILYHFGQAYTRALCFRVSPRWLVSIYDGYNLFVFLSIGTCLQGWLRWTRSVPAFHPASRIDGISTVGGMLFPVDRGLGITPNVGQSVVKVVYKPCRSSPSLWLVSSERIAPVVTEQRIGLSPFTKNIKVSNPHQHCILWMWTKTHVLFCKNVERTKDYFHKFCREKVTPDLSFHKCRWERHFTFCVQSYFSWATQPNFP